MQERREALTWRAILLVFLLAAPSLGTPGCGSSGSSPDPDANPEGDATGLQIANASSSCCRFVAIDVADVATGASQLTSGLDVQPAETSRVFEQLPGSYTLRVLQDDAGTLRWSDTVSFGVATGEVTLVTVNLGSAGPPPMPTGLIVANDATSCCRFVAVDVIDLATGGSTITSGLNVQPGQASPFFPLTPGQYGFRVLQDRGGTLTWIGTPTIIVLAGQVSTAPVVLT